MQSHTVEIGVHVIDQRHKGTTQCQREAVSLSERGLTGRPIEWEAHGRLSGTFTHCNVAAVPCAGLQRQATMPSG